MGTRASAARGGRRLSLPQLVDQNSYAIAAAVVVGWVGYELFRRCVEPRSLLVFAAFAAILVAPPLYLRAGRGEIAALDAALASGRPTLLEVYSDL